MLGWFMRLLQNAPRVLRISATSIKKAINLAHQMVTSLKIFSSFAFSFGKRIFLTAYKCPSSLFLALTTCPPPPLPKNSSSSNSLLYLLPLCLGCQKKPEGGASTLRETRPGEKSGVPGWFWFMAWPRIMKAPGVVF